MISEGTPGILSVKTVDFYIVAVVIPIVVVVAVVGEVIVIIVRVVIRQ